MTLYKYGKPFCVLMCFTTQSGAGTRESLETLDYTEREHHSWKDDILVFKGNRTRYRNLLEKELEKGKNLSVKLSKKSMR